MRVLFLVCAVMNVNVGDSSMLGLVPACYEKESDTIDGHLEEIVDLLEGDLGVASTGAQIIAKIAARKPALMLPHFDVYHSYLHSPRLLTSHLK